MFDHTLKSDVTARRLEVITETGRRRWFSKDDKARIVEETLVPGAVVSEIARRRGLTPQQVFTWRRQARRQLAPMANDPQFVPAVVDTTSDILHTVFVLRRSRMLGTPLFGRTLRVSPFRRGKDLTCIYTDERPDLCRELPNWMFDEGYCAGMTLGQAEISIEGLNEFAAVLASLGTNRKRGAQSSPSKQKEKGCAEEPLSQSSSARSRARKSHSSSASGTTCGRTDRGLGGPSAGSPEGGGIGDEGRR